MRIPRPDRPPDIAFRAHGEAKTAGSKVSGVAYRKGEDGQRVPIRTADGRIKTFTKDVTGETGKAWRGVVAGAAAEAMAYAGLAPLAQALWVEFRFVQLRPASHYGSGRNASVLKASSPLYPKGRSDVLKLARAAEDAMKGILYVDDSWIAEEHISKCYAEPGEGAFLEVWAWMLPASIETEHLEAMRLAVYSGAGST